MGLGFPGLAGQGSVQVKVVIAVLCARRYRKAKQAAEIHPHLYPRRKCAVPDVGYSSSSSSSRPGQRAGLRPCCPGQGAAPGTAGARSADGRELSPAPCGGLRHSSALSGNENIPNGIRAALARRAPTPPAHERHRRLWAGGGSQHRE